MTLDEFNPADEAFTYVDQEGRLTAYAVSALARYIDVNPEKAEKVIVSIDPEFAMLLVKSGRLNNGRINQLMRHPMWAAKPILYVQLSPSNVYLFVDGAHRYVLHYMIEAKKIVAYRAPYEVASRFIIDDVPKITNEQQVKWSGLFFLGAVHKMRSFQ